MFKWVILILLMPLVLLYKQVVYWSTSFEVQSTDTASVLDKQLKDLLILFPISIIASQMHHCPLELVSLVCICSLLK